MADQADTNLNMQKSHKTMNYFLVCHRKPIGLWNQKALKDYASDKHKLYRTVDQTMNLRKDIAQFSGLEPAFCQQILPQFQMNGATEF